MVTLVGRGHCVVAAVFHVINDDNTAEFDPYFIERIKNCITMMFEKDFVQQLELEIQTKHTFKNKMLASKFNQLVSNMEETQPGNQVDPGFFSNKVH